MSEKDIKEAIKETFDVLAFVTRVAAAYDIPVRYLMGSFVEGEKFPVHVVKKNGCRGMALRFDQDQNPCGEIEIVSRKHSRNETSLRGVLPVDGTKVLAVAPDRSRFPHSCPRCGMAAYVGMNEVDCSTGCGR